MTAHSLPPKSTATRSIVEPVPEQVHRCADLISQVADRMLQNDLKQARKLLDAICTAPLLAYYEGRKERRSHLKHEDSIRKRSGPRKPLSRETENAIFKRDGWHCRYCGIRVLDKVVPREFNILPGTPLWTRKTKAPGQRHPALYILWGSVDHVVPWTMFYSDNEANAMGNLVTACSTCNYGKVNWLLEQLCLKDPRDFPPKASTDWDGLVRLVGIRTKLEKFSG